MQARLAQLRAVRPTQDGVSEIFGGPAGPFGARAGRELGASRADRRLGEGRHIDVSHPYRWTASRWGDVARRRETAFAGKRQGEICAESGFPRPWRNYFAAL